MTNLIAVIPILMHLFILSVEKMYYLHKATSAVSCVKPNASQWEATLRDDVGFPTVYRRIYRRKFLTLSNETSRYIHTCIRIFYLLMCLKLLEDHLIWLYTVCSGLLREVRFNHTFFKETKVTVLTHLYRMDFYTFILPTGPFPI